MADPVSEAARAAAVILAPGIGPNLPAEVDAALRARHAGHQRPSQYDPVALASLGMGAASLVVAIAQLAWSIVSARRERAERPEPEFITRQVLLTLREQDVPVTPATSRITDVVVTEVIRLGGPPR
jgi:hypothetical protein